MDMSFINWLAILACVVASMVSGFLWYHPKAFFPAWCEGLGISESEMTAKTPSPMIWILTILAGVVQAVAVALMLRAMQATGPGAGAAAGFMLWLGFIAPTNLVNKLFAGHGLRVWGIEAGNHLLNMLLFGAILGVWM